MIARDDGGPGVYWLLCPDDPTKDGEWAAYQWFLSDDDGPDEDRHDDFSALLLAVARRLDAA